MSKVPKFCAHLSFDDGTNKDLEVKIVKRISRTKYECKIVVPQNPLNKNLTICKNGTVVFEVIAPKSCPSGCDCGDLTLTLPL